MKKIIITQSNYIPWKGYFDGINVADEFIIYDDMQYTKRDWRNRNQIKTPGGPVWLSVPVEVSGKFFQKINETKVSDPSWAKSHWGSILQNYRNAPFFKEYKDRVEETYLNLTTPFLTEINLKLIELVNSILGITTNIRLSSDFKLAEGRTERLVDLCKQVGGTDYYSGPAAKNYMDEELFRAEGINVHYFDYSGYPEYPQLNGAFTHALTVFDLIFNTGEDAKKYMKSFSDEK
jgi:hypothetical protein